VKQTRAASLSSQEVIAQVAVVLVSSKEKKPMNMETLIAAVRAHAEENYCVDGWDFLVECWDDEDIAEEIGDAQTVNQAIKNCLAVVHLMSEQRSEIEATIW